MSASNQIAARGHFALLLSALVCALSGCSGVSDDPNAWYNMTIVENFSGSKTPAVVPASISSSSPSGFPTQQGSVPPPGQQVAMVMPANLVAEAELYRSEMNCGGVISHASRGAAGPPASATSSIALEMTECEVARRVGSPDKVELGSGLRGERVLTLTYSRGERPRIYRFAAGRLIGIEILPFYPSTGAKRR